MKTTKELNDYEVTSTSEYDLDSKWFSEEDILPLQREIERQFEEIKTLKIALDAQRKIIENEW